MLRVRTQPPVLPVQTCAHFLVSYVCNTSGDAKLASMCKSCDVLRARVAFWYTTPEVVHVSPLVSRTCKATRVARDISVEVQSKAKRQPYDARVAHTLHRR